MVHVCIRLKTFMNGFVSILEYSSDVGKSRDTKPGHDTTIRPIHVPNSPDDYDFYGFNSVITFS